MNLLKQIQKKNVLVIGDVMLDTYFTGEICRISPEAPVPVLRKQGEWCVPGGAANVAVNLAAAGQDVSVLSIVGDDEAGGMLCEKLHQLHIDNSMILPAGRITTKKIRFIAGNNQQVMRLDQEDTEQISPETCSWLLERLADRIEAFDVIVLSDYGKGLLTESFIQGVIDQADSRSIPTLVDVKGTNAEKYRGAYLVKPNALELQMMTGMPVSTDEAAEAASKRLLELCRCRYVLTTRGGQGMLLVSRDTTMFVGADDHEVFDVTGAGDTALAYLAAAVANNLSVEQAVTVANHAAGLQVTKVGTSAISLSEVSEAMAGDDQNVKRKLLSRETASQLRRLSGGRRIVFTNGCFDILHVGHVRYLRQAAALGDILVVGINSDSSVRRLKGSCRPINTQADRAEILASLEFVDYVVVFDEDTPYELICRIQPDVLVKGGDYTPENVVGRDVVEARGGRLVILDFVDGKSTSGIIHRIFDGQVQDREIGRNEHDQM